MSFRGWGRKGAKSGKGSWAWFLFPQTCTKIQKQNPLRGICAEHGETWQTNATEPTEPQQEETIHSFMVLLPWIEQMDRTKFIYLGVGACRVISRLTILKTIHVSIILWQYQMRKTTHYFCIQLFWAQFFVEWHWNLRFLLCSRWCCK